MRNSIAKAASFALIAGAMVLPAAPAMAAAPAATTTVKADDPYSVMKVVAKAPKTVKRGGKITYKIDITNQGPYQADYYWIGGILPKGIKGKIQYSAPKGTQCEFDSLGFWCWGSWVLEKDDSDWLDITVTLKSTTKGIAKAQLGAIVYDVPTGMENIDKEEIDRLGFNKWFYGKKVSTKIVR